MALRNIVTEGDPILRKECREVKNVTDHIREVLDDMVDTMRDAEGVGLAGPQVGMLRRMFVAEPEPDRVYYMINPVITSKEGSQVGPEGCLSVPGYYGDVERPERITMEALDRDGVKQTYQFEGWDAKVMCHEYDHLDGIMYTDKAQTMYKAGEESEETEEAEVE